MMIEQKIWIQRKFMRFAGGGLLLLLLVFFCRIDSFGANALQLIGQTGTITMQSGSSMQLAAAYNGAFISSGELTWQSSRKKIVSVSNGRVTARSAGKAKLTARLKKNRKISVSVTVYVYSKTESMEFRNGDTVVIKKGSSLALKPAKGGKYREFLSSDAQVAGVSSNGVVRGVREGQATVQCFAYTGGKTRYWGQITVVVGQPVTGILTNGTPPRLSLAAGQIYPLKLSVLPASASVKSLLYTSSNSKVANVSRDGVIKGISRGKAVITCAAKDGSGKNFTVSVNVTSNYDKNRTVYTAHRGAMKQAPENTIAAFKLAGAQGADAIECDIFQTKDGHLVINHDGTLARMCGVDVKISSLTLQQLRNYPVTGGRNASSYPGQTSPTLEQFISVCNQYYCTPLVEIKGKINKEGYKSLQKILKTARRKPIVASFRESYLKPLRKKKKSYTLVRYTGKYSAKILKQCKKLGYGLGVNCTGITDEQIKEVLSKKVYLTLWGVNTREAANHYRSLGVKNLISDVLFM